MVFRNKRNDELKNLVTIRAEIEMFRAENPETFTDNFLYEIYHIIMDTLNRANDFTIEGLTEHETLRIADRIIARAKHK